MILDTLTSFSNRFGSDPELVLAGGGNTSAKDGNTMYVKASGTSLSTITPDGFVAMDRQKLAVMLHKQYPSEDAAREEAALADLMDARLPGQDAKRPSVETLLHALFPMRYVLHLHPALVNGLTCAVDGAAWTGRLFADAVWIEASKPGYVLAKLCYDRMTQYKAETGRDADCLLLQNHGIFLSDDNADALGEKLQKVLETLRAHCVFSPDLSPAAAADPALGELLAAQYGAGSVYRFCGAAEAVRFAANEDAMQPLMEPFTPDHIVYCKAHPLYLPTGCDIRAAFAGYRAKYGCAPKICYVQGSGFYALSDSDRSVDTAVLLALDAIKIAVYSRAFGGALPQSAALTDFIVNWEVEAYRARQAQ